MGFAAVWASTRGQSTSTTTQVGVVNEPSWSVEEIQRNATASEWCVEVKVASRVETACTSGQTVSLWRVGDVTLALFVEWRDSEPRVRVLDWADFESAHENLVPTCLGGSAPPLAPSPLAQAPERLVTTISGLLDQHFDESPPLDFFACGAGWIAANLSKTQGRPDATRQLWFLEQEGRWSIGPIVDYSLEVGARCAALPRESSAAGAISPQSACQMMGS